MRIWFLLVLGFLFSGCGQSAEHEVENTVLYLNGKIYTGDEQQRLAEAVVTEKNRIIFVGPELQARDLAKGAKIVDLEGAFMYPGFTDAHAHFYDIGQRELVLNLEAASSLEELVEKLAREAEISAPGEIIYGRGWIETHWPEGRFPKASDLDPVSPENPVILERADGHAVVINSAMMEKAGISENTENPAGGEILKNREGKPNGMLIDAAVTLLTPVLGTGPSEGMVERYYEAAAEVYQGYGWTGLHNMSVDPDRVQTLDRLSKEGRLNLRIYNSLDGEEPKALDLIEKGPKASENGLIITRAIKLYIDGALGSRGALLLEPYSDSETSGLPQTTKQEFMAIALPALKSGIQINSHAIGDAGNRRLLNWYEEAFERVPPEKRKLADHRWRDEHAQIIQPDDIPRFRDLGVIPSMQPSHAIGDLFFAPDRLGRERLKGAYAWRSLIDSGAIIAGGSDAPVERGDPRIEFYAAVARKSLDGFNNQDWHPEEAVSRGEALKMFTIWPAYASFREHELGSIEVGKLADFTVFSDDIMTIPEAEILNVEVVMTVVDGKIVYQRRAPGGDGD